MKRHISYLKYVMRHKWFVLIAGLRLGCPLWRLITHDISKFRRDEWMPYATTFYNTDGTSRYLEGCEFNAAWLRHQHRNPHHWQHWILRMDKGDTLPLDMPDGYILEMVADWAGAGRAITGKWEFDKWYVANFKKMQFSLVTRMKVDCAVRALREVIDRIENAPKP
jgi:hypothetical protein